MKLFKMSLQSDYDLLKNFSRLALELKPLFLNTLVLLIAHFFVYLNFVDILFVGKGSTFIDLGYIIETFVVQQKIQRLLL